MKLKNPALAILRNPELRHASKYIPPKPDTIGFGTRLVDFVSDLSKALWAIAKLIVVADANSVARDTSNAQMASVVPPGAQEFTSMLTITGKTCANALQGSRRPIDSELGARSLANDIIISTNRYR